MAGIWIFAEKEETAWELLTPARQIADQMNATVAAMLVADRDQAQGCINRGADRVLLLPGLPADQSLDAYLPALAEEIRKEAPDMVFFAATAAAKELAARLAVRLDTGLCSGCFGVIYDEGPGIWEMERLAYGGAAVQRVRCLSRPALATILPRAFAPAAVMAEGRSGSIVELAAPPNSPVKVLERRMKEKVSRTIGEAKVVVSVGRGLRKSEDLSLVRQLADALGGEVGCTRPISEECHWLPEDCCIGLSGVQVKPDLFLALGVSGQVQHLTGVRGAKMIAAVNRDENAPIFTAADAGIVGDLYDVVPKLLEALKK